MLEFVVVVESSADAKTATKLAERVLVEKVEWLETETLKDLFQWSGLEEATEHSCWRDIKNIIKCAETRGLSVPKFLGHSKTGPLKADGAATMKILNLITRLQSKESRQIRAVLLIRDLDNQHERREGIEQARKEHTNQEHKLEVIIGAANRMREAWVLNGFIPSSSREKKILEDIKNKLNFDPCEESHRLRSSSLEEPDRIRNPKSVLEKLTNDDKLREQQCWEETDLEILRRRGGSTGLSAYLQEIEERLIPTFSE